MASLLGLVLGPVLSLIFSGQYDPENLNITFALPERFLSLIPIQGLVGDYLSLDQLPYSLAFVASLKAILTFFIFYVWEHIGEKVVTGFRRQYFSAIVKRDPAKREADLGSGLEENFSSHMTNNLRLTKQYIVRFYGGIPREILQSSFLILTLFALSPRLLLYIVLFILPIFIFISRSSRSLKRRANRALNDYSAMSNWIEERLLGVETIKHYKTESLELSKMRQFSQGLFEKFLRAAKIRATTSPTTDFIGSSALAVVIYYASQGIVSGEESSETVLSFFACLGLLSQSVTKLSKYINDRTEGKAAFRQVCQTVAELEAERKEKIFPPLVETGGNGGDRLAIDCRDIRFTYPRSGQRSVIDGFTFTFQSGKFYSIFGHSGAGKTTLMKVLLNYLSPDSGSIQFNYPMNSYPMTYLPQDPLILPGTIGENVTYPLVRRDCLPEVMKSIADANFTQSLQQFTAGVEHHLHPSNPMMSGGQIQRLNLARVFFLKSPIILVDECTSALDPQTETFVLGALKKMADNGSCVIMIAHRPAVLDYAHHVLLLDQGKLVSEGPTFKVKKEVFELIKSEGGR
jgi:subfamily B ATP-binding cassette protein MsbA